MRDIKREYLRGAEKTPAKIPAEIVAKMLAYSSVEGDQVIDPFLGSGRVAVVASVRAGGTWGSRCPRGTVSLHGGGCQMAPAARATQGHGVPRVPMWGAGEHS